MSFNRHRINRLLSRVLLGLGIVFLLYVIAMYALYFFGNWQKP